MKDHTPRIIRIVNLISSLVPLLHAARRTSVLSVASRGDLRNRQVMLPQCLICYRGAVQRVILDRHVIQRNLLTGAHFLPAKEHNTVSLTAAGSIRFRLFPISRVLFHGPLCEFFELRKRICQVAHRSPQSLSTPNDPQQHRYEGNYQENMDQVSKRRGDNPEDPQDHKDNSYDVKHVDHLSMRTHAFKFGFRGSRGSRQGET